MLSDTLSHLWQAHIIPAYQSGTLCSERHLQALLYKHLNLPDTQVWVEPKLTGKNIRLLEGYTPDLLFTQGNIITAVMEIRFSPYYRLEPQNDLYRAQTFMRERQDDPYNIYLRLQPDTGDIDSSTGYQLAEDLLFVYAVIARQGSPALAPTVGEGYSAHTFLHLQWSV